MIGLGVGIGRNRYGGFSGLLNEFGDAAAAYSLRRLSSSASKAVQVRRESDNATLDIGFKSGELDTATLETFVNCEDVAPADYGSGAAAAYSLRYVSASYTGDVIQVRRSSDDTTQDFNPTEITDGTLATFCGAGDGFVTTWYDQSGNGNDATQTTASSQPKIYDSVSGVIEENGKPVVKFDGTDDFLSNTFPSIISQPTYWFVTHNFHATPSAFDGVFGNLSTPPEHRLILSSSLNYTLQAGGSLLYNSYQASQSLISYKIDQSDERFYLNGSEQTISSGTGIGSGQLESIVLGSLSQTYGYSPIQFQEIILYPSDQSSNRKNIETNINSYYGIYTSDANGYVTTWYDQSGSDNHATQTTAANQPQIYDSVSGVITQGTKSSIDFGTTLQNLCLSVNNSTTNNLITVVHTANYVSNKNQVILALSDSNFIIVAVGDTGKLKYANSNDNMISTTNVGSFQLSTIDINDKKLYINGLEEDSVSTVSGASTRYAIANYTNNAGNSMEGYISEIVIWQTAQTSNVSNINNNINDFYNIY